MDDETYLAWRRTIPFTDEQIVDALEASHAESTRNPFTNSRHARAIACVRAGRLSGSLLRLASKYLVKSCAMCGRPALYRFGLVGRCRAHKRDVPPDWRANLGRRNLVSARIATALDDVDRVSRYYDKAQRSKYSRKTKA